VKVYASVIVLVASFIAGPLAPATESAPPKCLPQDRVGAGQERIGPAPAEELQRKKNAAPGGMVYKNQYDGAGRTKKTFTTDGGGDTGWSDADDVTGDNVLSQSENHYDAAFQQ